MLINKAIEEIRKTRHDISAKYHHNTKKLLEHYKKLESKYSDRIYSSTKTAQVSLVVAGEEMDEIRRDKGIRQKGIKTIEPKPKSKSQQVTTPDAKGRRR